MLGQSLVSRDIVDGLVVLDRPVVAADDTVCGLSSVSLPEVIWGMRLGMTESEVFQRLGGRVSHREKDRMSVLYVASNLQPQQEGGTGSTSRSGAGISARFQDGKLRGFRLWSGLYFE